MMPSSCSSPAAIYSHVDDETLERLNAIALDGGRQHALSAAVVDLIHEQRRKGITRAGDSLLVTERRLVECSWEMVEAVLDFGNIVERACALTRLLGVTSDRCVDRKANWQAQLSQLLVRYPVLTHRRFAFAGYFPEQAQREFSPLPHLLARTPGAALPHPSHGIPPGELRRFARQSCVKAGLARPAANSIAESALVGRTPFAVAARQTSHAQGNAHMAKKGLAGVRSAGGGRYITSLMYLSELASQETGRAILATDSLLARDELYLGLAELFWDVATGAASSGVPRAEFVQAVRSPSIMPRAPLADELMHHIGIVMDRGLDGGMAHQAVERKAGGVRNAVEMLVEIGCQPDHGEAARWIAGQLVGPHRMNDGPTPLWNEHEIVAVLDELWARGARVATPPSGHVATAAHDLACRTWLQTIELHGRKADMMETLATRAADPKTGPTATAEPRRRMRLV